MATARRQPLSDIVAAAVNSPRVRPKSGKLARRGPPPALVLEPELEQLDEQVGGQLDEQQLAWRPPSLRRGVLNKSSVLCCWTTCIRDFPGL